MEFDYVIVGGGSAGCLLALRLSEDQDVRVALVERGPGYSRLKLGVPLLSMRNMSPFLQRGWTTQQAHGNNRRIFFPVASVLGGGSSVNAMIYSRGERTCYHRWAEQGAEGWDFSSVLPYFRKLESFEGGESPYHGIGGPIGISETRFRSSFDRAFHAACLEMGLVANSDFTGASQAGSGFYQMSQRRGERSSAAGGQFRRASAARKNLRVFTHTKAERLVFRGIRAEGVQCRRAAGEVSLFAQREIILAAGAIGSPKLLMLSGVGPADELLAHGIRPVSDVGEIGQGLQDHPRCSVLFKPRESVSLSIQSLLLPFFRWFLRRDGIFTSTTIGAGAFLRLSDGSGPLDTQFTVKWAASPPFRDSVDFQFSLVDVESRGSVRLLSSNPLDPPLVNPNYLSSPKEVEVMIKAIRFVRCLARSREMREFGLVNEILPGRDLDGDHELAQYIKNRFETAFHPAGTCRMGSDDESVVDPELRVRGVENLRVADASVMPSLINGNTNGPTLMIAEKAADLIRKRN